MANKKLTKTHKEILQTLRDNPEARIEYLDFSVKYRLVCPGQAQDKRIQNDTFSFLATWLKQVDSGNKGSHNRYYTIREDAEISDAWRRDELDRQRLAVLDRKAELERRLAEAASQSEARLRDVWNVLTTGNLPTDPKIGPYVITFEFNGREYRIEEGEAPNG